jgi:hypothetical protein
MCMTCAILRTVEAEVSVGAIVDKSDDVTNARDDAADLTTGEPCRLEGLNRGGKSKQRQKDRHCVREI